MYVLGLNVELKVLDLGIRGMPQIRGSFWIEIYGL